jgi:hypothetical protein
MAKFRDDLWSIIPPDPAGWTVIVGKDLDGTAEAQRAGADNSCARTNLGIALDNMNVHG